MARYQDAHAHRTMWDLQRGDGSAPSLTAKAGCSAQGAGPGAGHQPAGHAASIHFAVALRSKVRLETCSGICRGCGVVNRLRRDLTEKPAFSDATGSEG